MGTNDSMGPEWRPQEHLPDPGPFHVYPAQINAHPQNPKDIFSMCSKLEHGLMQMSVELHRYISRLCRALVDAIQAPHGLIFGCFNSKPGMHPADARMLV